MAVLVVGAGLLARLRCRPSGRPPRRRRRGRPSVAEAVAGTPDVVAAVQTGDPSAVLQPYAERVRAETRHRLRRGDEHRPASATPTPTRSRSASRSSATSAARWLGRHRRRGLHRHARAVAAGSWCPSGDGDRVVGARRGRHPQGRGGRAARATSCRACSLAGLAAALLSGLGTRAGRRAGSGARPTASARSSCARCTSTTTRCCTRSPRACCSPTSRGGCGWPTTRRSGCWGCPSDAPGRPVAELGLAEPLVGGAHRPGPARGRAARHRGPRARAQQGPGRARRPAARLRRDAARPHRPRGPHR